MNTKQTPENNFWTKLITYTIRNPVGIIAKLSNKKPPTYSTEQNRTEPSALKLKQPFDINKTKTFNKQFTNITYWTDKINRHIDHKIKALKLRADLN